MIPISPGDIVTLLEKGLPLRNLPAQLRERRADRLVGASAGTRASHLLYEFLQQVYYDLPVLMGPDGPFPVGVLPVSAEAASNVDRLSIQLGPAPSSFLVMQPEIVQALRRRGADLWNGTTFSLSSLKLDARGAVDGATGYLGSYFAMVNSADYLEYELLGKILQSDTPFSLDDLPKRALALEEFDSPCGCLISGGGVNAVIAVSTLVVYARENSYWMLCDVRSKRVAEYGDLYHVIPSFIYQPVSATTEHNLAIERGLVHNIYREYLEELFRIPEVERVGKPVAPDFFYQHPNLVLLKELLTSGAADLSATAVIFNLLNHRPEVCTVLVIRDDAWFVRQRGTTGTELRGLNLNDEFLANEAQSTEPHLEIVTTLPLDSPQWGAVVKPWLMVPPGAPALVLGAKRATEILGIQEPEWLRQYHIAEARDEPSGMS